MTGFQNKIHMFFLFASLVILSSVVLLVFPVMTIFREQYQDPSLAQRLLRHQTAVLSAQLETSENNTPAGILGDEDLEIELVTEGLQSPTSMTFIGNNGDMLVLEKSGEVIHFMNENKTKKSLLNFSTVDDRNERGLLGVAVIDDTIVHPSTAASSTTLSNNDEETSTSGNTASNDAALAATTDEGTTSSLPPAFVFFYVTEASKEDKTQAIGNRIYRFEWDHANKSLLNGTLLLDLPVLPGQNHNGGKLIADSNNGHLYAVIGDLNRKGTLQNFKNGSLPDDTSAIIRINPDGSPAQGNPFLNVSRSDDSLANLSKYYAYGIRNSFGLAIDPLTGNLW
ncbi:MAG TPA: PQQ-dependent sugar dehydrogenase, partial [Nitrososphaeraceae archaeon]|nr:PQQ-dependent sugar dehydrogenase [Nitrososphaeraceae archaeon]